MKELFMMCFLLYKIHATAHEGEYVLLTFGGLYWRGWSIEATAVVEFIMPSLPFNTPRRCPWFPAISADIRGREGKHASRITQLSLKQNSSRLLHMHSITT